MRYAQRGLLAAIVLALAAMQLATGALAQQSATPETGSPTAGTPAAVDDQLAGRLGGSLDSVTTLYGAPDFSFAALPDYLVPPQGSTAVTIRFAPTDVEEKTTTLYFRSNDADETFYAITLIGNRKALSSTLDTDGDGMSDASEFQLAALGFDWQVSQPELVQTLATYANGAGYYTQAQIQNLNIGTPLLTRNPTTRKFKLTIGVQKSAGLLDYNPFPFAPESTIINPAGEIEFEFTSPDAAAFFRLRTRDQ